MSNIWAKLNPNGILSDIRYGSQKPSGVWPDGSQDVSLVEIPTNPDGSQYTYDSVNKLAVLVQPRKPRKLIDIRSDLLALTGSQKTNIWNNFTSGSPPLWATDFGPNFADIFILQLFGSSTGISPVDSSEAKIRTLAFYCQNNPTYLVNPSFDPSINVPGDQLA